MIKLGKLIESAIKKIALKEYPKEACGVIVRRGKKLVAIQCENVADDPENRFVISSDEYRKHLDHDDVYIIWHSHTDDPKPATPSPTDIAACDATGVDWVIIDIYRQQDGSLKAGDFFHIAPSDSDEEEEYIGRPYIYGIKDCFTLARDYYRRELDIDIDFRPEGYPERTEWQNEGLNLLVDSYRQAGFVKLVDTEAMIGDLFLIQISTVTDHVAIYIGDDKILHHCMGRLSTIDVYGGGFWYKHTTTHLRAKKLMEVEK